MQVASQFISKKDDKQQELKQQPLYEYVCNFFITSRPYLNYFFIRCLFLCVAKHEEKHHMSTTQKKTLFTQYDYTSPNRGSVISRTFTPKSQCLTCMCNNKADTRFMQCMSCNTEVHYCLENKNNRKRNTVFECASCLSQALDPIYQVRKTFVKTYFTFSNIFTSTNQIDFIFDMDYADRGFPVEIRAIKAGQTTLGWPNIGLFFLNNETQSFSELRPLICNSNRKERKEEYILIPKQKLKIGKNVLHFKILCLDRERYQNKFKTEQKGLYFLSINSINQLDRGQLIKETFLQRRIEKAQSLRFMNPDKMNDIQMGDSKVNLICPYTKSKIKVPVRGKYCTHYSCVCLETMIAFHKEIRLWTCPLCDGPLNEPYVDIFIYTILSDNNQNGSEVWVSPSGMYRWLTTPQGINLDDSDSEQLTKNPDSIGPAPPETVTTLQIISNDRKEDALQKKIAEKKKTLEIIKMKMVEQIKNRNKQTREKYTLSSPMKQVTRNSLQKVVQGSKKEVVKSIKKEQKSSSNRKLTEVKLLQCIQVTKRSFITKEFFSKANRSELAKKNHEAIKKSTILKSFLGELI